MGPVSKKIYCTIAKDMGPPWFRMLKGYIVKKQYNKKSIFNKAD
jgi:hypothetical protein